MDIDYEKQVVVVDFDGTIIDNIPLVIELTTTAVFKTGTCNWKVAKQTAEDISNIGGIIKERVLDNIPHATDDDIAFAMNYYIANVQKDVYDKAKFFKYTKNVLQKLHYHKIPVIISSLSSIKFIEFSLNKFGLRKYITSIYSYESGPKETHMAEIRKLYPDDIVILASDTSKDMLLDADLKFRIAERGTQPSNGECVISNIKSIRYRKEVR